MRVLLVPEVYRPGDVTACGTVNDAAVWVDRWLDRDERLHVYWLLPPRETAGYAAADVHADRERVTLVEAEPLLAGREERDLVTEDGYSGAELAALREAIHGAGAYVDVVVDQRRTGRATLYKWLLAATDHWSAQVRPFDVVANVHDLQTPEKYRWCGHRNDYQMYEEVCAAAFADGIWFTAGVDARRLGELATDFLDDSVVADALDGAVEVGSPVAFDEFKTSFADEPEWFHLAGSFWAKKNADRVFEVAATLRERFGVRTVVTSQEPIPARYREPDWVEAHGEASRETYERALARGDLAVCASEYETMARTPFEQAASGQVLVLRDEPWIYDCVPEDYPLTGELDELAALAVEAVERWDEAVAAGRRLVEHAEAVRGPERVGERTYADLAGRVQAKREAFSPGAATDVVEETLAAVEPPLDLEAFVRATAAFTGDGDPLPDREGVARTDVVYALRSLGYADRGDPGTPVFAPVERVEA